MSLLSVGAYDSMSPFSNYGAGPTAGPAAKSIQQPESATASHSHMGRISADYSRTSSEYARQPAPSTPDYDTHRAASHDAASTGTPWPQFWTALNTCRWSFGLIWAFATG